jgi:hypothetical protein
VQKCNGTLYYDPTTDNCRACPKDTTFKNGTCECKDQYEFANNRCALMDGAVVEVPDAGMSETALSCGDYCAFANSCVGMNDIAKLALSDIITGLHADDTSACASHCADVIGGDGSDDPIVQCIAAGAASTGCANDATRDGLTKTIGLVGTCCKPAADNALCKSICTTLKANATIASSIDFCP